MCDVYQGVKYCHVNNQYIVGTGTEQANNADDSINSFRIVIPKKVNGNIVDAIGQYAFYENRNIVEVIIYARVKYIDTYAFCRCVNLATINIPASCTRLGVVSLDQYDQNLNGRSIGSLSIFFEKNSQIKTFDEKAIGNKDTINVYFCEPVSIDFTSNKQFIEMTYFNIYCPESFKLNEYQSQITHFCYNLPQIIRETISSKLISFDNVLLFIFILH